MQKDTIGIISSILQCQKIPEGIRIRLENHLFPNWKKQKTHLAQPKHLKKQKKTEKKLQFFLKNVFSKSHSAKDLKDGTIWSFLTSILLQNIKKKRRGTFRDIKKFSQSRKRRKVSKCRKKMKGRTHLVHNDFVFYIRGFGCVQKEVLSIYCKSMHERWTDRVELTKKLVTLYRAFSSKTPNKNEAILHWLPFSFPDTSSPCQSMVS